MGCDSNVHPEEKLKIGLLLLTVSVLLVGTFYYESSKETTTAPDLLSGPATQSATESRPAEVAQKASLAGQETDSKVDSVDLLLDGLIQRLDQEPDDVSGWVLLAKSYHHLERWEEAGAAFARARTLGYSGAAPSLNAAAQRKKVQRSHASPLAVSDGSRLALQELSRFAASNEVGVQVAVSGTELSLLVNVSPSLLAKLTSDTNVFIFARAADRNESAGSSAPLAVIRKVVADLPIQVELDDSMAMIAGRTISSVSNVIVGARVALSGSPVKKPGDPEILSAPIPSSYNETITLTILDLPEAELR